MRLVDLAGRLASRPLSPPVLMMLSPDDSVISPARARATFAELDAPHKELVEFEGSGDPSSHILAGRILSPETTGRVVDEIVRFIDANVDPDTD